MRLVFRRLLPLLCVIVAATSARADDYTQIIKESVAKLELGQYDAHGFYSDEQIEAYVADLVEGRRAFTEEIGAQGLRKDIRALSHRELDAMDAKARKRVEPWAPAEEAAQTVSEDRDPRSRWISPWEPRRPSPSDFPTPASRSRR